MRRNMNQMKKYMEARHFPRSLQGEVLLQHQDAWDRDGIIHMNNVMSDLSVPLRMELCYAWKEKLLTRIPLMESQGAGVRQRFAALLNIQVKNGRSPRNY